MMSCSGAANYVGGNTSGGGGGGGGGGGSVVVPNPSWTQAAWYVDPQDVSGLANDANTGADATHPVRTWQTGVAAKFQTFRPRHRSDVAITFLSSHTDGSDPVIYSPYVENGAQISISGSLPTATESGTLAALVAASNTSLLTVTLGAAARVGMLIVNTTRGNSVALLYKNTSGTTFALTQPMPSNSVGTFNASPVNTWATGDSYAVYALQGINLAEFKPTFVDLNAASGGANIPTLYRLHVIVPQSYYGYDADSCYAGVTTSFTDCTFDRVIVIDATPSFFTGNSVNCWYMGGISGGPIHTGGPGITVVRRFAAGALGGLPDTLTLQTCQLYAAAFSARCILGAAAFGSCDVMSGSFGGCYLDTGVTVSVAGMAAGTAGGFLGVGNLNVIGPARFKYSGTAVGFFLSSGAIKLNGGATACSASVAGGVATINAGIAINPANLDAAAGAAGFGGTAFNLGGACITNGGN